MATFDTRVMYDEIRKLIDEHDAQIDAAEGSTSSGKRAFRSNLVNQYQDKFQSSADRLRESVASLSIEEKVAAHAILVKTLNAFSDEIDKYIEANLPEPDENAQKLSDEEKLTLYKQRKELTNRLNKVRDIAEAMGEDPETYPPVRRRNMSVGKRGKQALTLMAIDVFDSDGMPVELPEDCSLNDVAKDHGYENSRELKADLKDRATWRTADGEERVGNFDTSKPPSTLELVMKDGFSLVLTKSDSDEDDDEDENESDDD